MRTHTVMEARVRLEQLGAELVERGWPVEMRGTTKRPYLRVVNPDDLALNGRVAVLGEQYRWTWGPVLGPADDVRGVADRIVHVLRGVAP